MLIDAVHSIYIVIVSCIYSPLTMHALDVSPPKQMISLALSLITSHLFESGVLKQKNIFRGTSFQINFKIIMVCTVLLSGHHIFFMSKATS